MSEGLLSGSPAATRQRKRLVSIDAARAITVALMVFMDHPTIISALPRFLVHPEWNGFRLPDMVFPAFIFIAGVSLAFSSSRAAKDFSGTTATFVRRAGLLFALGLALNLAKYGLPLRYLGVLQRISLSLLIAWPFVRSRRSTPVLAGAVVLLIIHAAVLVFVGAPGVPAGTLAPGTNISGWLDSAVLGVQHTYKHAGFDPEGVLGTLSSGAQALLGLALGLKLIERPRGTTTVRLALWGVAASAAGILASLALPLNKSLWTPTYVLLSSGICTISLLALYHLADVRPYGKWFSWLVPLGRNALLVYILSSLSVVVARVIAVPTTHGGRATLFYGSGIVLSRYMPPMWASLAVSATEVAVWFVLAWWLDRRKWYFKV